MGLILEELEGSKVSAEKRRDSFILHFGDVRADVDGLGSSVELGYEQLRHLEFQLLQLRLKAPPGTEALPASRWLVERKPRAGEKVAWSPRYVGPDMAKAFKVYEAVRKWLRQGSVRLCWDFPGHEREIICEESSPNLRTKW